jgi:hypothetical protein
MERRDKMARSKEDDPITAPRNDHAQSKCRCAWPAASVNTRCSVVLIVLLFQENKSCGDNTICIHPLMYVESCREQKLPGYGDSENVRKMSSMPVNKMAMQNVHTLFESLCDERSHVSCQGSWLVRHLPGPLSRRQEITKYLKIMITI